MLTERTGVQTKPNILLDFRKEARTKKELAGYVEGHPLKKLREKNLTLPISQYLSLKTRSSQIIKPKKRV